MNPKPPVNVSTIDLLKMGWSDLRREWDWTNWCYLLIVLWEMSILISEGQYNGAFGWAMSLLILLFYVLSKADTKWALIRIKEANELLGHAKDIMYKLRVENEALIEALNKATGKSRTVN